MSLNDQSAQGSSSLLQQILLSIESLRRDQLELTKAIESTTARVNGLSGSEPVQDADIRTFAGFSPQATPLSPGLPLARHQSRASAGSVTNSCGSALFPSTWKGSLTSKVVLTSYPNQAGVRPIPMKWGDEDPQTRGRESRNLDTSEKPALILLLCLSHRSVSKGRFYQAP